MNHIWEQPAFEIRLHQRQLSLQLCTIIKIADTLNDKINDPFNPENFIPLFSSLKLPKNFINEILTEIDLQRTIYFDNIISPKIIYQYPNEY